MRQSSNAETGFLGSISSSSIRNLLPKSISSKRKSTSNRKIPNSDAENTPPSDPNIQINHHQSPSKTPISQNDESKPPLESTTPHNPLVKVVVRIRPANSNGREGEGTIKKVSSDTLCVEDRQFTFDEVFDINTNQEDVFQSVGVPLVRDALAGYNTSILSYGQPGSGKSYTMWGPQSAMVEEPSRHGDRGIVPRIFQMLFAELEREQSMSDQKQFNYNCRCSFLEIYNEKIRDLLNPIQHNFEMKDDSKNALNVENLIEEYVTSCRDVMKILSKGLSSRKAGATCLNSNSPGSHVIFIFIIESWCKGTSPEGFSSSKTSRISLIDLAGLKRNKINDAGIQCLNENRNMKKSLSQLERLVDALTKESQSGKAEDIPSKNSSLSRLLQESLGGNAKLSVICCIYPDNKSNGETLQRVRSIGNEPLTNEMKEDDGNDLSDIIGHLKDELIRSKTSAHSSVGGKNGYFQGRNMRESLNQLRVSLNRSLFLPNVDNDTDEEVNVNEDDMKQLRHEIDNIYSSCDPDDMSVSEDGVQFYSVKENCDADVTSGDEIEKEVCFGKTLNKLCNEDGVTLANTSTAIKYTFRNSLSVSSCSHSPVLDGPQLSESPKFSNSKRKSMAISSSCLGGCNNVAESSNFRKDVSGKLFEQGENCKLFPGPTESLAASLQRGLQIIDYNQRNSLLNKSSSSFSFDNLTLTPCSEIDKVGPSDQTIQQKASSGEVTATLLCASCLKKISDQDSTEVQDRLKSWIDTVKESGNPYGLTDKVSRHMDIVMAKGIMREKELENVCKEQAARIDQLNKMVEKLKGEKDPDSIVVWNQETSKRDEYNSFKDENKHLRGTSSDGNLPSIREEECEIKEVQEELAIGGGSFDAAEKESLLKEILNLRSKLQSYSDAPVKKSTEKLRSSLMLRSIQLQRSGVFSHESVDEELENERQRWTEMESEWICLTDDLRVDFESCRQHAEKVETELMLEKKCTAELDDALKRAVAGHAKMVEHYADLQEKYDVLISKHDAVMEGIAEVKKAAAKAKNKGHARFAKSLAAELSALRMEREREAKFLKKENHTLKIQLRDTAEAVQAAGELLVRLREAEHAASVAEENFANVQRDNEMLKKQIEKLKRKHKTEMSTMKQYLTESKLPESALRPLYQEDCDVFNHNATPYTDDDQAWRAEFGAIYQEHY